MFACHAALYLLLVVNVISIDASWCNNTQNGIVPNRYLSRGGIVMNITLHWASDPARAASALFAVILREALGYQRVVLRKSPYFDLGAFAANVPHNQTRRYDEVILALSTAWLPGQNPDWAPNKGAICGIAGPRLEEIGASSVPVRERVHVYLAHHFQNRSQCLNFTRWSFYTNVTTLQQCGFTAARHNLLGQAMMYKLDSNTTMITNFKELKELLRIDIKKINRTELFEMLRIGNHSFLFVDYDMWSNHSHVKAMPQPICLPSANYKCLLEQYNVISMRVGDVSLLTENAPAIIQLAYDFTTKDKTIRDILELESNGYNIEQAAKTWAIEHNEIKYWKQRYDPSNKFYDIAFFYCEDDPNIEEYDTVISGLFRGIILDMFKRIFQVRPLRFKVNCSDANDVKSIINSYVSLRIKQRLIGAIVGSVNNIIHVAKTTDGANVPVLFYDAIGVDTTSSISTWVTTGRTRHLTLAIRHFIVSMNWTRVAVLSEPTESARRFIDDLKSLGDIAYGDHSVPLGVSEWEAESLLQNLKNGNENAHVLLVNTNYKDAATILAAATSVGMNSTKDYAWITREWRPDNKTAYITHFTISFWCRCGSDPSSYVGFSDVRADINLEFGNCTWPPHISTLTEAIFTLLNGFKRSIDKCPQIRDDTRNKEAIETFGRSITDGPIQGITQNLTFKGRSLEETVVFVEEWHGHWHNHLARWRVNADKGKVLVEHEKRAAYPQGDQPHDGSSKCHTTSGDPYLPTCHDWVWITAPVVIIFTPPTLLLVYYILLRRLKEHEKNIIGQLLAVRQQRAAALTAGYLVDRSVLSLRYVLGSGRFGFVRLALLCLPGSPSRYVAAKSLRESEDESEILHEACILASLNHENIIRLVGVCIDKEPPLVLMEIAFFGDLHQYLRDRRYLAEGYEKSQSDKSDNDESTHVSAEALTQLARQAASALAYLALRGVIHRDLRASNCLVTANRTLKLADFGLARETNATNPVGVTEYACRRRGIFPVLWMAPESLMHGIFSTASDVWALGVLVFELMTLGSRPFGDMSPLCVMQYVVSGGNPTMPRDASPHAVALARLCWQREPEQRPTAANVVAYLAERPNALRPAFDADIDQSTDADSGCDEYPMTELLPC